MKILWTLLALLICGCISAPKEVHMFATSRLTPDFDTYTLERVGLMPFVGRIDTYEQSEYLQSSFFTEFSRTFHQEIVPLNFDDLEEVPSSEPYRRGSYEPKTVLSLARRFNLDALLVGTVTEIQSFPPQRLSVQVDLVASETGQVIWSSSVHLDARNQRVRDSIEALMGDEGDEDAEAWEVTLLSPSRFAQFAAWQIAHQFR